MSPRRRNPRHAICPLLTVPAVIPHRAMAVDPQTDLDDLATATVHDEPRRQSNPFNRFLKMLGPGLVTGASDDDPSGIGTYATAGAQLGYTPLWTALLTFPLMASVQFICAKVGLVSGR